MQHKGEACGVGDSEAVHEVVNRLPKPAGPDQGSRHALFILTWHLHPSRLVLYHLLPSHERQLVLAVQAVVQAQVELLGHSLVRLC